MLWALKETLGGPHAVEPPHEPLDQEGVFHQGELNPSAEPSGLGPVHCDHGDPIGSVVFQPEQIDGEGQRGSACACHLDWPQ